MQKINEMSQHDSINYKSALEGSAALKLSMLIEDIHSNKCGGFGVESARDDIAGSIAVSALL